MPRPKKPQQVTYRIIREPRKPNVGQRLAFGLIGVVVLIGGLGLAAWLINTTTAPAPSDTADAFPTATARPTPTFDAVVAKASLAARRGDVSSGATRPSTVTSGPAVSPARTTPSATTVDANSGRTPSATGPTATPTFGGLPLPASGSNGLPTVTPTFGGLLLPGSNEPTTPSVAASPTPAPPSLKDQAQLQLKAAWLGYKQDFIQSDGRVVDPQQGGVSTSEGQSYALLRAVWQDDREVFDRVWHWTHDNLEVRSTDRLFAYRWGKGDGDKWQIIDDSAASDADSDIALALIWAARRWNAPEYGQAALTIIQSLWDKTVVTLNGKSYLTAGDWSPTQLHPSLNPSYQSPYAFRLFAALDPAHNWLGVVDGAYDMIQGCSTAQLNGLTGVKLPPNWCGIDKQTGAFVTAQDFPKLDTNYGYDAFRTMWRLALDYKWFGEKRALDFLKSSDTLRTKWSADGKLLAEYDFSGKPVGNHEDLAVYAGDLANFVLTDPTLADQVVSRKLLPTFRETSDHHAGWGDLQNYYTQNWAWFGLALYADGLPTAPPDLPAAVVAPKSASATNPTATPVPAKP